MKVGKIRLTATIVAQYAAGVELEAIMNDGKIYLPVSNAPAFEGADEDDEEEAPAKPKAEAPKKEPSKKAAPAEKKAAVKTYTEDEMMDMESKELEKILKKEYGVNPDDFDGKNTNKKLRKLILEQQEKAASAAEELEDEDDEEETEDESEENDITGKVGDLLEDFDAGKRNKKKTIAAICDLVDDADQKGVTELVEQFENDTDVDLDEIAEKIAAVLSGEEPKKEKPAKKGKKEEKLVDPEDLEVGDRVSVYWDDDNKDWFDGEVKSIKKGKIVIAYDDDTEEAIDPEIHTKIRRI